jgi:hypothetical protein
MFVSAKMMLVRTELNVMDSKSHLATEATTYDNVNRAFRSISCTFNNKVAIHPLRSRGDQPTNVARGIMGGHFSEPGCQLTKAE